MTRHWAMSLLTGRRLDGDMPTRVIDYSPLTDPVAPADVAAWRAQVRASGSRFSNLNSSLIATYVFAAVLAVVSLFVFGGLLLTMLADGFQDANASSVVVPLIFIAGFAFAAVTIL